MFHATLDSTKTWKQIVDAIATLLTEANFKVDSSGIFLRQMDSSKVAMIDLKLPKKIFQEYDCKGEHDLCLGIDELVKVSKRMSGDERLEFNLEESDNRLEIKMIGRAERMFKLQRLTPLGDAPREPSVEWDVTAEMDADAFKQAIKDIAVVANNVTISADSKGVSFSGQGDTGEARVNLSAEGDPQIVFNIEMRGDSKSPPTTMYALSYLSEMSKAIASDTIALHYATEKPMMLDFQIAEAGQIRLLLAPRKERR